MMSSHDVLSYLRQAVTSGHSEEVRRLLQTPEADEQKGSVLLKALTAGLHDARGKMADASATVAEFLLSVDALHTGAESLKTRLPIVENRPKAVVGVVQGDVHELGAAIISGVMDALGYSVTLLGQNTTPDHFIATVASSGAKILGLSSMMSTTLPAMKETIDRCRRAFPEVQVIVGGAALDESIAKTAGADGYAASAVELPAELERLNKLALGHSDPCRKYTDYERKIQVVEKELHHGI